MLSILLLSLCFFSRKHFLIYYFDIIINCIYNDWVQNSHLLDDYNHTVVTSLFSDCDILDKTSCLTVHASLCIDAEITINSTSITRSRYSRFVFKIIDVLVALHVLVSLVEYQHEF